MNPILFYLFGAVAIIAAILMLFFRNPVSSAISLVVSFLAMAALFIGLDAHFIGVIQVLVYTGAIMVLFIFIIMLLNVKKEESKKIPLMPLLGGLLLVGLLTAQIAGIVSSQTNKPEQAVDLATASAYYAGNEAISSQLKEGNYPNASIIGQTLFEKYNGAFLIAGFVLVVATVGVVSLSRRPECPKSE